MSNAIIKIQNLSKRYYRHANQARYSTLRDSMMETLKTPLRWLKSITGNYQPAHAEAMWALRDISFEVERGEVIGLIGHNGAGKTTLLKILSRITEPTSGTVDLLGRVGSLLEVGTGFHPELSGRENIFLNGAILGMKRAEITKRFDEIVAFSEVDQYIDTPVKYYSSGMYLRLAFAVAAHLQPDILLVDEVLAVGDAAFQHKCLGKMDEVAGEGRTVIFVSHDMSNIAVLCQKAILLNHGQIAKYGLTQTVIEQYLSNCSSENTEIVWQDNGAPGNETVSLSRLRMEDTQGYLANSFSLSAEIHISIDFLVKKPGIRLNPVVRIKNSIGMIVFTTANYEDPQWGKGNYKVGRYRVKCIIPGSVLNAGQYSLDFLMVREMRYVAVEVNTVMTINIYDSGELRGDFVGDWVGVVRPPCKWTGEMLE